jgi:hypothetical protein
VCRASLAIVDGDEESEQDGRISEQRGARSHTEQVVWHRGGRIGRCEEGDEESEQDGALVRAQGVAGHRGHRR